MEQLYIGGNCMKIKYTLSTKPPKLEVFTGGRLKIIWKLSIFLMLFLTLFV